MSYHIKKLESDLGLLLFRRTATGLELTEAGAILARHAHRGFSTIEQGLEQISDIADTVRIALLPMFASRWLSPRLGSLLEAKPNLRLSIQNHNNSYARMSDPESFADLGIQWGQGHWSNFHVTRLWSEKLVVVCSPDYLRTHPIKSPHDLQHCTLLHVDDTQMWQEWFSHNGLTLSDSDKQMMLEDRHFQLSSTINGLGVSLFASWLVQGELQDGVLIDPFKRGFKTSFAYHMIIPLQAELSKAARDIADWLGKKGQI